MEKAFVRAMNWIIGSKQIFLEKLYQDIYRELEPIEEKYSMELLHARLGELQQEMKSLVKRGMKAGVVDEEEHYNVPIKPDKLF